MQLVTQKVSRETTTFKQMIYCDCDRSEKVEKVKWRQFHLLIEYIWTICDFICNKLQFNVILMMQNQNKYHFQLKIVAVRQIYTSNVSICDDVPFRRKIFYHRCISFRFEYDANEKCVGVGAYHTHSTLF